MSKDAVEFWAVEYLRKKDKQPYATPMVFVTDSEREARKWVANAEKPCRVIGLKRVVVEEPQ